MKQTVEIEVPDGKKAIWKVQMNIKIYLQPTWRGIEVINGFGVVMITLVCYIL